MPSLANRACSTPGCNKPCTAGPRCEVCKRARQVIHDARRGSGTERGYDEQHCRLRLLAFQRDNWRCVDCGWQPSVVVDFEVYGLGEPDLNELLDSLRIACNRGDRHLHGEHIIPIDQRPDLRLELENYATRCNICHQAKTLRELKGS